MTSQSSCMHQAARNINCYYNGNPIGDCSRSTSPACKRNDSNVSDEIHSPASSPVTKNQNTSLNSSIGSYKDSASSGSGGEEVESPGLRYGSRSVKGPKGEIYNKPSQNYIALISLAILSKHQKKILLNEIYEYFEEKYPYFKHVKNGSWKNSIRHNLSLNECFVKNGRSNDGKGNFWSIHPACVQDFTKGDFRRRQARRRAKRGSFGQVQSSDVSPNINYAHPIFVSETGNSQRYQDVLMSQMNVHSNSIESCSPTARIQIDTESPYLAGYGSPYQSLQTDQRSRDYAAAYSRYYGYENTIPYSPNPALIQNSSPYSYSWSQLNNNYKSTEVTQPSSSARTTKAAPQNVNCVNVLPQIPCSKDIYNISFTHNLNAYS